MRVNETEGTCRARVTEDGTVAGPPFFFAVGWRCQKIDTCVGVPEPVSTNGAREFSGFFSKIMETD